MLPGGGGGHRPPPPRPPPLQEPRPIRHTDAMPHDILPVPFTIPATFACMPPATVVDLRPTGRDQLLYHRRMISGFFSLSLAIGPRWLSGKPSRSQGPFSRQCLLTVSWLQPAAADGIFLQDEDGDPGSVYRRRPHHEVVSEVRPGPER